MMIKKKSRFDVGATLDRLETILKEKGIKPIARVDHAEAAKSVGMELRPTQVLFFGNPKLGTPLMQRDQMAGLAVVRASKAWALMNGRNHVEPGDVKAVFGSVAGHRLTPANQHSKSIESLIENLLEVTPIP